MAKTLQFRRGTTDQLSSVTGAEGELFVDLDKDVVVVMDGVTAGGHALQSELVSSTNIKTVNGNSLLGSGDIDLSTNLTLTNNNLEYTNIDGTVQTIDLSPYLDDTTNTIISGVLSGNEITFTREDSTTFTVDVTNLYDDTNLVTSVNGQTGEVVIDTTNWDTAYSWGDHAVEGYLKSNIDGSLTITSQESYSTAISSQIFRTGELYNTTNYIDFSHITGEFLSNGNFVQIIGAFSDANYLLVTETNTETGAIENVRYIWNTDPLYTVNVTADGSSFVSNGINRNSAESKLYIDSNNIIIPVEYVGGDSAIIKCDLSYGVSSVFKINNASSYVKTTIADGYLYTTDHGFTNSGTTRISKFDLTTGTGIAELNIPYTAGSVTRVDTSGNLYVVGETDGGPTGTEYNAKGPFIAKYSWNGTGYDNVWQKVFDIEQGGQFSEAILLNDDALYINNLDRLYSFNLTTGDINWSKDFDFANFSLPNEYVPTSAETSGVVSDSSGNVYVRTWFQDDNDYNGYPDYRFFAIQKFDNLGNYLDSIIVEAPAGVTYGEWYSEQHYMYINNNKLVIPCLKNYDTKSGLAYDEVALQLGIDTIILDTNFELNVGLNGKFADYKIVDSGIIYTNVSSTQTVSDDTRIATNQATTTTITITSDAVLYDDTVVTGGIFAYESSVAKYKLNPTLVQLNGDYDLFELNNVAIPSISTKSISLTNNNYTISEGEVDNGSYGLVIKNKDAYFKIASATDNTLTTTFNSVLLGNTRNISPADSSVQIGALSNNTGTYNVVIGREAGPYYLANSGSNSVYIGSNSGRGTSTSSVQLGSFNVGIGNSSQSRSRGSNCISIGSNSTGRVDHTGDNQITIGNISQPDPTASTCLAIGHHTSGTFSGPDSYWLTGDSSFNVNIPQKLTVGSFETPEVLLGSDSAVTTRVTAVASITPTAIETFAIATYRSAKLQIQVTQGSNYQISDLIVIHDGTTASINENISLSTGSLICTFAVEITGGNLIVNTVMNTADAATVKVVSTKVTV